MSRIEFILAALLVIMNHDVRPKTAPGLPPCKLVSFSDNWPKVKFNLQATSVKLQVFFSCEP